MQELDGTSLYDRPDWPLPSPPTPPNESVGKNVDQDEPVEMGEERVEDSAVLRKPEEISVYMNGMTYAEEYDVSDIEEDDSGEAHC